VHGHDSESWGGTHHVAFDVAAELKDRVEAKLHMFYFGFC
jgi:hypothetical protein